MKFIEKIGNDLFGVVVTANSIVLDNSSAEVPIGPFGGGDTTIAYTNGIIANFSISSKQNTMDNWISDPEYLNYTKINFILIPTKEKLDDLFERINNKDYLSLSFSQILTRVNLIDLLSTTAQIKTVSLNELVNIEDLSNSDYKFDTEYTVTFSNLDQQNDIILLAIPYIDFSSYFSDNQIDDTTSIEVLELIYKVETYQYNILIKNKTISDDDSELIFNDVRELASLTSDTFSSLPVLLTPQVANNQINSKYLSDVFSSFDYENEKINNYVFFNIQKFLIDNSAIPKIFDFTSKEKIDDFLNLYRSLNFYVYRSDKTECVSSGSVRYGTSVDLGDLTTDKTVCLVFQDDMPSVSHTSFNYTIKLDYVEPFVKEYYNVVNNVGSGSYFKTLNYLSEIKSYVDDPRNSDVITGKFIFNRNAPVLTKNNLVSNFFEIYNAFSSKVVSDEQVSKISKSLNFQKATLSYYNDFLYFVERCMLQFEAFFSSFSGARKVYEKQSSSINFKKYDFYFSKDTDNENINYFNEINASLNTIKKYDILTNELDRTNTVSYKLINTVINLNNNQISYSQDYSLLSNLLESSGVTIDKSLSSTSREKSLFSKSSIVNNVLTKPATSVIDAKKQKSKSTFDLESTSIDNIVNKVTVTDTFDYDTLLKFQLYFLSDINSNYLIPKLKILLFTLDRFEWARLEDTKLPIKYAYLAKTIVDENEANIFTDNNLIPPINNEYFIYTNIIEDSPIIEKFTNVSSLFGSISPEGVGLPTFVPESVVTLSPAAAASDAVRARTTSQQETPSLFADTSFNVSTTATVSPTETNGVTRNTILSNNSVKSSISSQTSKIKKI